MSLETRKQHQSKLKSDYSGVSGANQRPFLRGRLWAIAFLAVVVKAILLFGLFPYFHAQFPQDYSAGSFGDSYQLIAWNLAQGNGYRMFPDTSLTMLRTPGFVLLLSLIFAVFGKSLVAVQIVNLVFSSITAVLTQILSRKAGLSSTAATIAALIFFFHPGLLIAESRGALECMLTLCLAASVLLAVIAMERQKWPSFAMAGVIYGITILVKPSVAPVLPVLFLYRIWRTSDRMVRRKLFAGMAISGLATVLVMTPWVVRNYRLSGEFRPTMTVSGMSAFTGAYVIKHLDSNLDYVEMENRAVDEQNAIANAMGLQTHGRYFPAFTRVEDEVSFYRELGRRAVDDYRREPELILRSVGYNACAFWVGGKTHRSTMFNAILTLPLLVLFGIGLGVGMKTGKEVFQFFLITVVFMIPHLFIIAKARYSIPLIPFVAILAAIPLAKWFECFAGPYRELPSSSQMKELLDTSPIGDRKIRRASP
ncbi:MAG TPA: glycosyltransferase family 39 protein [Pyrinomonadaceae bacterium]|nr:glycosyltransferase family 39 protein [Pyrinomonadaceae bacterium]